MAVKGAVFMQTLPVHESMPKTMRVILLMQCAQDVGSRCMIGTYCYSMHTPAECGSMPVIVNMMLVPHSEF